MKKNEKIQGILKSILGIIGAFIIVVGLKLSKIESFAGIILFPLGILIIIFGILIKIKDKKNKFKEI
jgi:hypothetical protein